MNPPHTETMQRLVSPNKFYINCPKKEIKFAKELGAMWEGNKKVRSWYIPSGLNLCLFARWLSIEQKLNLRLDEDAGNEPLKKKNKVTVGKKIIQTGKRVKNEGNVSKSVNLDVSRLAGVKRARDMFN